MGVASSRAADASVAATNQRSRPAGGRMAVRPARIRPVPRRVPARRYRPSAATTAASCSNDSTDAARRSSSWVVRRWISTSTVAMRGPPRILITPNEVKVNRNTIDAAPASAGRSWGSVTVRKACQRVAPSVRAASSTSGSTAIHAAPTVRAITA